MPLSSEFLKAAGRIGEIIQKEKDGKKITKADTEFIGRVERFISPLRPETAGGNLPSYYGLKPCHAQTGIPIVVMKQHRDAGAPGFRGGQIQLKDYLPWCIKTLMKDPDGVQTAAAMTGRLAFESAKAKREEIRLLKDQGRAVDWDEVEQAVGRMMAMLFTGLERVFLREAPAELHHLSERQFSDAMAQRIAAFKQLIRDQLAEFIKDEQGKP